MHGYRNNIENDKHTCHCDDCGHKVYIYRPREIGETVCCDVCFNNARPETEY